MEWRKLKIKANNFDCNDEKEHNRHVEIFDVKNFYCVNSSNASTFDHYRFYRAAYFFSIFIMRIAEDRKQIIFIIQTHLFFFYLIYFI